MCTCAALCKCRHSDGSPDQPVLAFRTALGVRVRLGNPNPSARIKRHRNGLVQVGFPSDEIGVESVEQRHACSGVLGREALDHITWHVFQRAI